jgi:FkbM family methyltransferase
MTEAERRLRLDHLEDDAARRVVMTTACRDTDPIPKVDGAGEVFERDGLLLQRMHNGLVIVEGCYHGAWMTEVIRALRGHHEPQEELAFHAVVERVARTEAEPAMVEIGSWWGYYSLWFAHATGGGVVALEPDESYLDVGRRNFELNGLQATFLRGAIGVDENRTMSFLEESTGRRTTVPAYDLRSLLDAAQLDRASVVLADIQGAETALLRRGRPVLEARRVRFLVLSTHHHSISGSPVTHQDARDLLDACGAHFVAEHTVGESFSGDGLIVAAFEERDRDLTVEISRARYADSLFGELEHDLAESWRARAALEARASIRAGRLLRRGARGLRRLGRR